ncbi:hypothetical protein GCM10010401_04380 [Rarobacter faecitabidus]|uniref:Alpha-L-rhamnosidase six-hairpin glycosidase domain-containing protein n=1 Tax=Rarobacter faecitabidus TaxID=13243 RepID=A0A542ZU67_RARFA|nr:Ig-like domain repeat protein [Rarobacter faecitabidus]TQL63806.1 hypothetical protein FB461_0284 [Rarobacter faecitabidus]
MKLRLSAIVAAVPLALTMALTPAVHAAPSAEPQAAAVTTDDLADSSAHQQRWISSPGSRITLNPGNPAELAPTIPLKTEYFGWGGESYQEPQLKIFRAQDRAPQSAGGSTATEVGFREDFNDLATNNWQNENVTSQIVNLDGANKGLKATTAAGSEYGNVYSKKITVNLTEYPMLTVSVPELGGGGVSYWALKIWPDGSGDRTVQSDTNQAGTFDYDLSEIDSTSSLTGVQTFQVRLFVTRSDGVNARTATFDYLQFWGTGDDGGEPVEPTVGFSDPMNATTQSLWSANNNQGNGMTYSADSSGGRVTRGAGASSEWGAIERSVTVDLDRFQTMSITVGATSGSWNAAIVEGGYEKKKVASSDLTDARTVTLDVASATGWSGTKTFQVRIYHNGAVGSSTLFTNLHFSGTPQWLDAASSYTSTWRPEAIDYTAQWAEGDSIAGFDTTVGMDAFGRVLRPTFSNGYLAVLGRYQGEASYDKATGTLSVITSKDFGSNAWSVKLPAGTDLYFFTSEGSARKGKNGGANPRPGGGYWAATLDPASDLAIGFGYELMASNSSTEATRAAAASAAHAGNAATVTALEQARTGWRQHYNDFLAQVPAPQDFELSGIDAKGLSSADVKRAYYTAWIGLETNIMAPTPETQEPGDGFWQIATGKPSTYASGPRGAEASAEWDSLFGIQFMSYIRPQIAWSAFKGNLKHAVPEPGTSHETLPSRKAQTAWILYEVTGDQTQLASVYDRMVQYLDWASRDENMQWSYTSGGKAERDAEFYVSMIVDLGYAAKISRQLGHESDAQRWEQTATTLTSTYASLFFPPSGSPLYKTWIANTQGWPIHGNVTEPIQYVLTGLHTPGLGATQMDKLKTLFNNNFNVSKGLAGLTGPGNKDIKAPDIQFVTYGLLGQGMATEAEQVLHIMNRDIIRSGVFAETYGVNGDGSIWGGSVAPSIFGNIHFIDNVWIANGYRMDVGDPAILRLPGTTGGLTGLKVHGLPFDLDIDGSTAKLSGTAVNAGSLPASIDVSVVGQTVLPPVAAPSSDASLSSLAYDGVAVPGFTAAVKDYQVELPVGSASVPQVSASAAHPGASVSVSQAAGLPGTAEVVVTAADGTTATYSIHFTVATKPGEPGPQPTAVTLVAPATIAAAFGQSARLVVTAQATGAIPAGDIAVFEGSRKLASAKLAAGRATVVLPAALAVGRHSFRIAFTPSGTSFKAAQASSILTVTKAKPTLKAVKIVSPKKAGGKIKRGKAAKVKVIVAGVAGVAPTGKVVLKAGKRTVASGKLKKSGTRSVVTVTIKKSATKGLKKTTRLKVAMTESKTYSQLLKTTKLRVVK